MKLNAHYLVKFIKMLSKIYVGLSYYALLVTFLREDNNFSAYSRIKMKGMMFMLGEIKERFDTAFLVKWQQSANKILDQLEIGLNKIEFTPEPIEVTQLKASIAKAKAATSIEEFINEFQKMDKLLKTISTKYDFKEFNVNDLFFHGRRIAHSLNSLLETKEYSFAALNPANKKEKDRERVGFIKRKLAKKGAKEVSKQIFSHFEKEKLASLALHVNKIPPKVKVESYDDIDLKQQVPILSEIIGKEKYRELRSSIEINDPTTAAQYISEQIYGKAFETYYVQIALLYDALQKIDTIALNEGTDRNKVKIELLKKYGLHEADSNASRQYMDTVAKNLGFKDTKELHQNFTGINKEHEFEKLKKLKTDFMKHGNADNALEDDPLEKIFGVTEEEFQRNREKTNDANFLDESGSYFTIMDHFSNLKPQVQIIQRGKNIGDLIAQFNLDPNMFVAEEQNFLKRMLLRAGQYVINDLNFKEYLDSHIIDMVVENKLYEKRLSHVVKPINDQFMHFTKEKISKRNSLINELLKTEFNGDTQIKQQAILQQQIAQCKKELKAINLDTSPTEFRAKENELEHLNNKYNDNQIAYDLKSNEHLLSQSKPQLQNNVKQFESQTAKLQNELKNNTTKINELNAGEKASKKKDNKFPRVIRKWIANFAGIFKYKTPFSKARAQRIARWQEDVHELNGRNQQIETEIPLRIAQADRFKNQISLLDSYNEKSTSTLVKDIVEASSDLTQAYQNVMTNYQAMATQDDTSVLRSSQQEYVNIEYKLNTLTQLLALKLERGTLTVNEIESLLNNIKTLKESMKSFDKEIITPFEGFTHPPLDNSLNSLSTKLEEILLEEAKILVDSFVATEGLNDPFAFLFNNNITLIENLSKENALQLYDYTKQKYIEKISTEGETLDLKTLQKNYFDMRLGYHFYHHQQTPIDTDAQLSAHYQDLSNAFLNLINAKFAELHKLDIPETQKALASLDEDFVNLYEQQLENQQKAHSEKATYDSYFYNAFGWFKKYEDVKKFEDIALASNDQLQQFLTNYTAVLDKFINNAPSYYMSFEQDKLNNEIERLEKNLKGLKELVANDNNKETNGLQEVLDKYEKLVSIAKDVEKSHPNYTLTALEREVKQIKENISDLNNQAANLQKEVSATNQIDEKAYQNHLDLQLQIKDHLRDLKIALTDLEAQNKRVGVSYLEFDRRKALMDEKLNRYTNQIDEHEKNYQHELKFYHDITEDKGVNISSVSNKVLGNGLMIAIQHHNEDVINSILKVSEELDPLALTQALQLSAILDDTETFKKILFSEKTQDFSDIDLSKCIDHALFNDNTELVCLILLNTNITLHPTIIKNLKDNFQQDNDGFEIKRATLQVYLPAFIREHMDNDALILKDIRQGFVVQNQLLDYLHDEYEEIREKQKELFGKEGPEVDTLNKQIKVFLDKVENANQVRNEMISFYVRQNFDTPERKEEHIKRWTKEIDTKESALIKDLLVPDMNIKAEALHVPDVSEPTAAVAPVASRIPTAAAPAATNAPPTPAPDVTRAPITHLHQTSIPQQKDSDAATSPLELSESMTEPSHAVAIEESTISTQDNLEIFNKAEQFSAAKQEVEENIKNPEQTSFAGVVNKLKIMKQNLTPDTQKSYQKTLANAINTAARTNKPKVLLQLLNEIDDPILLKKYENNALNAALSSGHIQPFKFLLRRKAFEGNEHQLMQQLLNIPAEKENLQNAFQHSNYNQLAFQVLANMPTEANSDIINLIKQIASDAEKKSNSSFRKIEKMRLWWDRDAPKLESIRHAFVITEKMYHEIQKEMAALYDEFDEELRNSELTKEKIQAYESKIAELKTALGHQDVVCKQLILNVFSFHEPNISNKDVRSNGMSEWYSELGKIEDRCTSAMNHTEAQFKEGLAEAKAELSNDKRNSYLPSKGQEEGEQEKLQPSAVSSKSEKVKPRF